MADENANTETPESLVSAGLGSASKPADKPAEKAADKPVVTSGDKPAGDKPAAEKTEAPAGYIKADDLDKIVRERVERALKDHADKGSTERQAADTRERYIRQNMNDLPLSMQNLMPKTGDQSQLAAAEQNLRTEMRDWLKKVPGYKSPDVAGVPAAGTGGLPPIASTGGNRTASELVTEALQGK